MLKNLYFFLNLNDAYFHVGYTLNIEFGVSDSIKSTKKHTSSIGTNCRQINLIKTKKYDL